jgi:putative spermidine/putrescine transport system permease protein
MNQATQELIQQLINGLSVGAIYALIAVGYTMVYGVLQLINFAHGDVFMVGAILTLVLARAFGFVAPDHTTASWLAFAFIAALGPVGVVTVWLRHLGYDPYAHGFTISSMTGVGLCYVYFQIPLMVILITPALEGLRAEWQDAALSLGASRLGYLRHVAVPVLLPSFVGATLILFGNAFSAYATALALVGSTLSIVPAQIDNAINGNVLVGADRIGLTLGAEMIIVILVVMVGYWLVQRRARRWLR